MTKESLAASIDGREYLNEVCPDEAAIAKRHGLIIVYGQSDDNMEFDGAIYDELGAFNGTTALLYCFKGQWKVMPNESDAIRKIKDFDEMQSAIAARQAGNKVEACWGPQVPDASWLIRTELPHATFDIMEDGDLYCRGLVLDVADLK